MSLTSDPPAVPATKARWSRDAKVIGLVAVAHFMSHVHGMLLPPILGQVKEAFGVTYTQVALAITVFNIASALLQTPTGFLVDRIGPRLMLTGGLILSGAAITAAALLPGYWFFIIAYGLMGVANTVYHPADYSILSATVDGQKIGKASPFIRSRDIWALAWRPPWCWARPPCGAGTVPSCSWPGSLLRAILLIVAGSVLPRAVRKPRTPQDCAVQERGQGRARLAVEPAHPAQPPVLLLPRHGQWRYPDLHRGRHGRDPRHAGLGRQRGAVGLPAS